MAIVETLIQEMEQEAKATRRVLERIPDDKLAWKPHAKSMSLGRLAMHTATVPGTLANIIAPDTFELPESFDQPEAASAAAAVTALDESVAQAKATLQRMDEARLMATWKLVGRGKEIMSAPRIGVLRSLMLNHWYHHRGQLSVYLRLLDVPVPSIYGPSADENPFG